MPPHFKARDVPMPLLDSLIDDIGPIYEQTAHPQAKELWQLLMKPQLKRGNGSNERWIVVSRYVANGGNPVILARWLRATGALGNHGNVVEVVGLLASIANDTLRTSGEKNRYKVYNWTHKERVPLPPFEFLWEDKKLYVDATLILLGKSDEDIHRLGVHAHETRWKRKWADANDIFETGWTEKDL